MNRKDVEKAGSNIWPGEVWREKMQREKNKGGISARLSADSFLSQSSLLNV